MSDFYSVIAQIIPVLVLAIVVETRLIEDARTDPGRLAVAQYTAAFTFLVAWIGEITAIAALARSDKDIAGGRPICFVAVFVLCSALGATTFAVALRQPPSDGHR